MLNDIAENVGSKTLFNAVFNSPEQVLRFLLCRAFFLMFINAVIFTINVYGTSIFKIFSA